MAFLDWPLSDGSLNPDGWTQDRERRAEHSHRLLGMKIGLLCIVLVVWTQLREARSWVRRLAVVLLLVVILQGVVGGARVRFDQLNTGMESNWIAQAFAVIHACGAQITLCLLVTLALATSRRWIERRGGFSQPASRKVRIWGVGVCLLLFLQILIGAVMRHANLGLAIHTFPFSTSDGAWLPESWNWAVSVNFAHRAGALVSFVAILGFVAGIWRAFPSRKALGGLSLLPLFLVVVQILLGGTVVWFRLNEYAATLHLLVGAFLLASCWMLTLLSFRLPLKQG